MRTFAYSISLLVLITTGLSRAYAQDTIPIPLKIKIGMELSGPVIYYTNRNIMNAEGYISVDLNEKRSLVFDAGYLNFKYVQDSTQHNYSFRSKGSYIRVGMDFNLLKPDKSQGKYFAGIGLRYGLSRFSSETPYFDQTDYWGKTSSSIARSSYWAHFLEISPGVRAEIFNHFTVGWSISLRMLIHSTTGGNLKSINIPGFGDGTKTFNTGLSYFVVWNIPFKTINAILKKEVKEEPEDNSETNPNNTSTSGNQQQGNTIRQ